MMRMRGLKLGAVSWLCVALGGLSLWCATAPAAGGSSASIDGREWELVSPVDKHGAGVQAPDEPRLVQASEDGSAITYTVGGPGTANPAGYLVYSQFFSRRGSDGWSSQNITTPFEVTPGSEAIAGMGYELFSPDLSVALLHPPASTPLPPLEAGAEGTLYLRNSETGSNLPLVTTANVSQGKKVAGEEGLFFSGATPDLSHILFWSNEALTANAINTGTLASNLYEWAGGQLQLVSVLPDGQAASTSSELGREGRVANAVSSDGSRVMWTSEKLSGGHLYMRDMKRGETVQLDVVQSGAGSGENHPIFQAASSDGSRVFFTDAQALTAASKERVGGPEDLGDLYVFEVSPGAGPLSGVVRDLSVDENVGEAGNVMGVSGVSEDGSYVYFVAQGALAPNAVQGDCPSDNFEEQPSEARCNLYVEHHGAGGWEAPRLVAVISGDDRQDWGGGAIGIIGPNLAVRVSPNGRYLAFMSDRSLTGFNNLDAVRGLPDEEVYLYDASVGAAGRVVCASCDPTGERPVGIFDNGKLLVDRNVYQAFSDRWLAGSIPAWVDVQAGAMFYQPRFLSDSGRLFFNSPVALVPGDGNGKEDVYEYEPASVGGCQAGTRSPAVVFSGAAAGCVGLISSGTSGEESVFLDASATGGDAFFITSAGLVPQDVDGTFDVYDTRECPGGSPCATSGTVLSSPPCSSAEACRGALSSTGALGSPGSATFTGSGNVAPSVSAQAPKAKPRPKALSRAQKLARALKACRKKTGRRRALCEKRARAAYGARTSRAAGATARTGR